VTDCRKQAWLWAQGDIYHAQAEYQLKTTGTSAKSANELASSQTMLRSSSLKRSVLKSRQEHDRVDTNDDSVSCILVMKSSVSLYSCCYEAGYQSRVSLYSCYEAGSLSHVLLYSCYEAGFLLRVLFCYE